MILPAGMRLDDGLVLLEEADHLLGWVDVVAGTLPRCAELEAGCSVRGWRLGPLHQRVERGDAVLDRGC